jgi:tRNA-specific 2-thiouridylase
MNELQSRNNPERVMAAMSGGVDSSVMALLLHQEGYEVTGVTMKLRHDEQEVPQEVFESGVKALGVSCSNNTCCSLEDVEDAKAVCRRIGVPHYTFNFGDRFQETVIDKFCNSYHEGLTPNPCIDCNRYLKFESLQRRRKELDLDYVATGHYVRRVFNEDTGLWELWRATDLKKDQSYVLFHLTQDTLAHMLFPLGELTKPEVREYAREFGLITADKPESQDICFVPDGNYVGFIERATGCAAPAFQPGPIVNREGKILATHRGLIHYTIGQRKGIGVAAPRPLFVYEKRPLTNELVVGFAEEVLSEGVEVGDVNFISGITPTEPLKVQVKTHYRQSPVPATAYMQEDGLLYISYDRPQRVAAPGQAAVLYDGEKVLGGGTIVTG